MGRATISNSIIGNRGKEMSSKTRDVSRQPIITREGVPVGIGNALRALFVGRIIAQGIGQGITQGLKPRNRQKQYIDVIRMQRTVQESVQQGVQIGLERTMYVLLLAQAVGQGIGQGVMRGIEQWNQQRLGKRFMRQAQYNMQRIRKNVLQGTQTGLFQRQDTWQTRLKRMQNRMARGTRNTSSLFQTQRNGKNAQRSTRFLLLGRTAGRTTPLPAQLVTAQSMINRRMRRARERLQQAQKNLGSTQNLMQTQLTGAARRRKRTRTMFRLGLLTGVILIILFAPWPGSETRRQLNELLQKVTQGRLQPEPVSA